MGDASLPLAQPDGDHVRRKSPASTMTFADCLIQYRKRRGLKATPLGIMAGVDPSYLSRLERGIMDHPSIEVVTSLAIAMELSHVERDQLLMAARYLPADVPSSVENSETVYAVLTVLNNEAIPRADRTRFARTIKGIAEHWGGYYESGRGGAKER
jgi:transcriptional regulator with XRE-family HTH domain